MNTSAILAEFSQVAARKLAISSEDSYRIWIGKFLRFLDTPECRRLDTSERKVEGFLSGMAREDYSRVSQNQAFNAILFLYRHVFKKELKEVDAARCKTHTKERYAPTREEIVAMFRELHDTPTYRVRLLVALLYGCGLRVTEGCQLRIKDLDIPRMTLTVHDGKGMKDRQVRLPELLVTALQKHIARAEALAAIDIAEKQPVQLPGRLAVKYPAWQFQVRWHFLFPSPKPCEHPRTGQLVRWCVGPDAIQRAVKRAAVVAGVEGKVTPHCLRHSFCSHLLDSGKSMRRVQEAMGHSDIRTTACYARKECLDLVSPMDG
jgi:integron integrase